MRIFLSCAGFALLLAPLAPLTRADATLRYHSDIQVASIVPAADIDKALGGNPEMILRIKGDKTYSEQGHLVSIMDLKTQDLTTLDAVHKRFATVPASQYAEQAKIAMPAVPEQARAMLASMKTNVESHMTGRTATIQGIQTEEHEFVVTIDMAMPGVPSTGAPFMKMVMQMWTPKLEEVQRVLALREYKNYMASATFAMNPAEMMKQLGAAIPGFDDNLSTLLADVSKDGAMALRTHMEIVMPLLALLSQQMPQKAGQAGPAGLDPNAPLMQMTQELVELSTDPLDDAIFQIPADYQPASLEEILKGVVSVPTPPQFKP
jgi:hypothetical protein